MDNQSRRKTTSRTTRTTLVHPNEEDSIEQNNGTADDDETTKSMGKKSTKSKEREKKIKRTPIKERWLLTRKTWKYMTDAGRRLIPDGVTNRTEDLQKIEEYFQHVCRNEPKFLPWRRKASYPGALTSLRRKRKSKLLSSPPKASSADEADDEQRDDGQRLLVMIKMLERFLSIKESASTTMTTDNVNDGDDTTNITSAATLTAALQIEQSSTINQSGIDEEQQASRESLLQSHVLADHRNRAQIKENWFMQSDDRIDQRNSTRINNNNFSSKQMQKMQTPARDPSTTWTAHSSLLLENLKNYSKSNSCSFLTHDRITADMLHDKRLLRQIRDELKQQQLMRLLRRHSSRSSLNITGSTSSSADLINFWQKNSNSSMADTTAATMSSLSIAYPSITNASNTSNASTYTTHPNTATNTTSATSTTATAGTGSYGDHLLSVKCHDHLKYVQTDPIPITIIYQLYDELLKKTTATDKINDDGPSSAASSLSAISNTMATENTTAAASTDPPKHSKRKSSIDNEDVSQSVSDTIKRYLRMARKKGGSVSDANRFKRVNYDKHQVRQQKPFRELTPPFDEDGCTKGTQTDSNWMIDVIEKVKNLERECFSPDSTDEEYNSSSNAHHHHHRRRERVSFDYSSPELDKLKSSSTSPTQSSPPSPSPSGLFHSSTQFLSNLLWHSHNNSSMNDKQQQQQQTYRQHRLHKQQQQTSSSSSSATAPSVAPSATPSATANDDYNHFFPAISAAAYNLTTKMQKSKSSSNVGPSLAKKIWKSRSKSHSRTTSPAKPHWIPQGNCVWTSASGKKIQLASTPLHELTEVERKSLHRVAVDRINQLNIGVSVSPPNENDCRASIDNTNKSQKKRPMLLKRKARTTSFFDTSKSKSDSDKGQTSGRVFGLSLERCVDNDNKSLLKQDTKPIHSELSTSRISRNSLTSLLDINRKTAGSYESLPSKGLHFVSLINPDDSDIGKKLISSISHTDIRRDSQIDDDEQIVGINRTTSHQVPALVTACINHLLKFGLDKVGIFRVSTSKRRVRQLREDFDNGTLTTLDDDVSPHDSASLLKEFLRDLPEPLLCTNLYHGFVHTQKIRNRRLQLEALSHLIQLLPVAHRDTLYVLLKFLATVAKQSDDKKSPLSGKIECTGNKMDSANLATVIAPNILHLNKLTQQPSESEMMCGLDVINVTRIMIDHFEEIFMVPAEVLDDVYTTMMDLYPEQLNYLCERKNVLNHPDDDLIGESFQQSSLNQSASFTISPSDSEIDNQIQQRIYARQDFMHENAAKGDSNGSVRRRERSSKMKYQEPEHEVTRRRRRDRSNQPADTEPNQLQPRISASAQSTIHSASVSMPIKSMAQSHQVDAANNATMPTSYLMQGAGIVSASFRLPLQVQIHDNPTLNLATADYQNIPYIEDGTYGNESPSLSAGVLDYCTSTDFNRMKSLSSQHRSDSQRHRFHDTSSQQTTKLKDDNNKALECIQQPISSTLSSSAIVQSYDAQHKEPKITASISNIGGAVLRSKTADFEKLLKQNKKPMSTVTMTSTPLSTILTATAGAPMTMTFSDNSSSYNVTGGDTAQQTESSDLLSGRNDRRPAQIYKRKEIIASVQTSNK